MENLDRENHNKSLIKAIYEGNLESVLKNIFILEIPIDIKTEPPFWQHALEANQNCNKQKIIEKIFSAEKISTNSDEQNPLMVAARQHDAEAITWLIQNGYQKKVNEKDLYGLSSIHYAASGTSNPDIIKILIDNGADPNCLTIDGETPLHYSNDENVTLELLKLGANPSIKNNSNKTPIETQEEHIVAVIIQWQNSQQKKQIFSELQPQYSDSIDKDKKKI